MIEQVDIERVTEEESRYTHQLREQYSRKAVYTDYLGTIRKFLAQKDLSLQSLSEFEKNEDTGTVYVLVEERFRTIHHKLAWTLLDELRGSTKERELETLLRAFREDFTRAYSEFLRERGEAALLFETASRKLFQEGIDEWFFRNRVNGASKSLLIGQVSGKINALLTPLRLSLAKDQKIDVFLFSETFSKSPLIPSPLSKLTLNDIGAEILRFGLTPNLFEKVAKKFQLAIQKDSENEMLALIRKRVIKSKRDLVRSSDWTLYSMSTEGIETLKHILGEKVSERFIDLTQRLRGLQNEWEKKRERFEQTTAQIALDTKKALAALRGEKFKASVERLAQIADSIAAEMNDLSLRRDELEAELKLARDLQNLSAEELASLLLRKSEREIERHFHIYHSLSDKFGHDLKNLPPEYTELFSELIKEELAMLGSKSSPWYESLSKLEEKHLWKRHYDVEELKARWVKVCTEVLEPLVITKCIEQLLRIWPPVVTKRTPIQPFLLEARYVGEELVFNGRLYHLSGSSNGEERQDEETKLAELRKLIVDRFKEVVSVLVYDIRGSTFMGNKLNDAKKESEIRNNFNIRMMHIARAHRGFVVKDTGDGGILFFSDNSSELQRSHLLSDGTGSPVETPLCPSRESAKRAMECARDMLKGAFSFVEDNLEKYGDWFDDVRKESLRYKGITYAQLPPEYKSIFKVGIGIASGKPDVDIYFGLNGFGDSDITGGLVREANFYSKARSKERSIILCDEATLLNFLLNADEYEPQGPQPTRTRSLEKEYPSELLVDSVWRYADLKRQKRGYKFGRLGLFIEKVGTQVFRDESLGGDFTLTCSGLRIAKSGEFLDERNRKVKILYQIIPEWMK